MNTYKALKIKGKWYCTDGVKSEQCTSEKAAIELAKQKNTQ